MKINPVLATVVIVGCVAVGIMVITQESPIQRSTREAAESIKRDACLATASANNTDPEKCN